MYIVSYDITNDRCRNKIAKELENYGLRVQYSVFECDITKKKMDELYEKLIKLLQKDSTGNIRIYSLCETCKGKTRILGVPPKNGRFSKRSGDDTDDETGEVEHDDDYEDAGSQFDRLIII